MHCWQGDADGFFGEHNARFFLDTRNIFILQIYVIKWSSGDLGFLKIVCENDSTKFTLSDDHPLLGLSVRDINQFENSFSVIQLCRECNPSNAGTYIHAGSHNHNHILSYCYLVPYLKKKTY